MIPHYVAYKIKLIGTRKIIKWVPTKPYVIWSVYTKSGRTLGDPYQMNRYFFLTEGLMMFDSNVRPMGNITTTPSKYICISNMNKRIAKKAKVKSDMSFMKKRRRYNGYHRYAIRVDVE